MAIGKQNLNYSIGEIFESEKGTLWGYIRGEKVFLKQVTDQKTGKPKWFVNVSIDAYLSDVKSRDQDFQG